MSDDNTKIAREWLFAMTCGAAIDGESCQPEPIVQSLTALLDAAEARGREQAKAEVVRDLRMTFAQNRNAQELADYIERGDHAPPAVAPSRPARTPEQVREMMAGVELPRVLASDEPVADVCGACGGSALSDETRHSIIYAGRCAECNGTGRAS